MAVPQKLIIKFSVKKKCSKKQKTAQYTFIYVILREKYKMLHYVYSSFHLSLQKT